jgi:hypothetical protein
VVSTCGEDIFPVGALSDRPFAITGAVDVDGVVELMGGSLDGVAIRRIAGGAESLETDAATLANEGLGRSGDIWAVAMMDCDKGYKSNPIAQAVVMPAAYETGE